MSDHGNGGGAGPPPSEKTNTALFEAAFILAASIFLVLFLVWLASRAAGAEAVETLPAWIVDLVSGVWGWVTGAGAAALLGFLVQKGRRSPVFYIGGILGTTLALVLALFLVRIAFFPNPTSEPPVAEAFELRFASHDRSGAAYDVLSYLQLQPALHPPELPRNIARQASGFFEDEIPAIAAHEIFEALLRRVVFESHFVSVPDAPLRICLRRLAEDPVSTSRVVVLECTEGRGCRRDPADPGWMGLCEAAGWRPPSLALVSAAWAQDPAGVWEVPSLATLRGLPDARRPGFTEFRITAAPGLVEADAYSFAIRVNGTPVRIDGWEPELMRHPYSPAAPFEFEFALENLDFSGAHEGRESIALEIDFLRGDEPVRRFELERDYVALRPAEPVAVSDGAEFRWSGEYRAPLHRNKFEIFIVSVPQVAGLERVQRELDATRLEFEGRPVVGVLRPPLGSSRSFGVVIGLREPSGQVRFTYDEAEAARVCDVAALAIPRLPSVVRNDSYRYEMEPRPPDVAANRPCAGL